MEYLVRLSMRQRLHPIVDSATYEDQQATGRGEEFMDALTFEELGWGDCVCAVVHYATRMRQQGARVYCVIGRVTIPGQQWRWHAMVFWPAQGLVIDPTAIVFKNIKAGPGAIRPAPADLAQIDRQVAAIKQWAA